MARRKDVSTLSNSQLSKFRTLLDEYITKPKGNPVKEHRAAGKMSSGLMIHEQAFLTWHQHFLAELETWLVNNGGQEFVPLPYWDPAAPIPAQLDKNNTNVNMPLPANLQPAALKTIGSYMALNSRILPYHGAVHDNLGGAMPDREKSPGDPIFWPFHSYLVGIYEQWLET
jgi:hypothetical protein